jgi:hypothetical protein
MRTHEMFENRAHDIQRVNRSLRVFNEGAFSTIRGALESQVNFSDNFVRHFAVVAPGIALADNYRMMRTAQTKLTTCLTRKGLLPLCYTPPSTSPDGKLFEVYIRCQH